MTVKDITEAYIGMYLSENFNTLEELDRDIEKELRKYTKNKFNISEEALAYFNYEGYSADALDASGGVGNLPSYTNEVLLSAKTHDNSNLSSIERKLNSQKVNGKKHFGDLPMYDAHHTYELIKEYPMGNLLIIDVSTSTEKGFGNMKEPEIFILGLFQKK